MDFQRVPQKFICTGMDVTHAPDLMPPGKWPYLKNVRSYQEGQLGPRPGIAKFNGVVLPDLTAHSLHRLNDYVTSSFLRFVAAGTNLYAGTSSYSLIDGSYNGDPLTFVNYQPEQSNNVWAYIANSSKMRKVSVGSAVQNIGILPPTKIPDMSLRVPNYQAASPYTELAAGWTNHDSASGTSNGTRLAAVVVNQIVYTGSDGKPAVGGPNWCVVGPQAGNYQNISAGMRIRFDAGGANDEICIVEEVHKVQGPSGTLATIASIEFDDLAGGAPWLVTIQPSVPLAGITRNTGLLIGGATPNYVQVLSVTDGPNGVSSFRCYVNNGHVIGNTISQADGGSFVVYTGRTHVAGETLTGYEINSTIAPGGPGKGTLAYNLGAPGIDFSKVNGRPFAPDDYIHMSFKADIPERIVEATLILDVDAGTTNVYNAADGNKNAFVRTFRSNDFQAMVRNSQTSDTARTRAIQLQIQDNTQVSLQSDLNPNAPYGAGQDSTPIDTPAPTESSSAVPLDSAPSTQMNLGDAQWTEFYWKVADFVRIGGAQWSDLSSIRAIQLRVTVSNDVTIGFSGVWIGGTYGPDTGLNLTPIIYRHRYRSSVTGAKSIPGPATRSGIQSLRQGVVLTVQPSSDAQVDKIDIERLGADNLTWHYVGTAANSSPTFIDDQLSAAVLINPPLETDAYMPFPIAAVPVTMVVNVSGTAITRVSGDAVNGAWARGTEVVIGGIATSLYATPNSASVFHVADNLGALAGVVMTINQPIVQGTALPIIWGPYKETIFACGNPLELGTVYFTRGSDPDSAPLANKVEVCSASEALMNGCLYDSRMFVFSDRRMFFCTPGGVNKFQFEEVANSKGLWAQWALAIGPKIWFLSQDGIYESDGGTPTCISDDISPLFPQGDRMTGVGTAQFKAVKMNTGSGVGGRDLRLCYYAGYLFFDYVDTDGVRQTLIYDTENKGWFYDDYANFATTNGFICHFLDQGYESGKEEARLFGAASNGFVYQHRNTNDDGSAIPVVGRTPCFDTGDQRALKVWGDLVLDTAMGGLTLTVVPYINNYATALPSASITSTGRAVSNPIDLDSGNNGQFARNLAIEFSFSVVSEAPQLYFWSPSFLARPENTFQRADDWDDAGYGGSKLVRGFLLEADTDGSVKGFDLQADQAVVQSFTGTFTGQQLLSFAVTPPQIGKLLRIKPTQDVNWRKFRVSYLYDKYPESSLIYSPYINMGLPDAKFVQGVLITAMGEDPACTVEYDGNNTLGETLHLYHPGNALSTKAYSFVTPFVAHELRLKPSANVRIENIKWIFEPSPELAAYWKTQGTSHGINGWQFLKDGYITHSSTSGLHLTIKVDTVPFTFDIAGSGLAYKKDYIIFDKVALTNTNLKGKLFEYHIFSDDPFRLFKKDCEIRVHQWGGDGYQIVRPFGGQSFADGAAI